MTIKNWKENININLDENGKDTTLQQDIDTHMTENRKLGWKGKGGGRAQSIDSGWREKRGIKSRDVRIKQLESETITLTKKNIILEGKCKTSVVKVNSARRTRNEVVAFSMKKVKTLKTK